MALVTLSVLEGRERGQIHRNLQTPVTIGREEENTVQLNDERISRLHAKLQDDGGTVIFTDLNSTNGSRVNGHPVSLRVLRPGDHLQLGRSTLLFGSDQEISERARQIGCAVTDLLPVSREFDETPDDAGDPGASHQMLPDEFGEDLLPQLFVNETPPLPENLTPIQRARLSDVLMYIHDMQHQILRNATETDPEHGIQEVHWHQFQNLLQLQRRLAVWLRDISGQ